MPAPVPVPSPRPYGPNTDAVRRLLQRLAAAPAEAWVRAARVYDGLARTPRYAAAERALADAIAGSGRERERDAVVGPVVQIAADAAERAERAGRATATPSPPSPLDSDHFAEPALAAALAVIAGDLLGGEEFEVLYGAVGTMVGVREIGM